MASLKYLRVGWLNTLEVYYEWFWGLRNFWEYIAPIPRKARLKVLNTIIGE